MKRRYMIYIVSEDEILNNTVDAFSRLKRMGFITKFKVVKLETEW